MGTIKFEYKFDWSSGRKDSYTVDLDAETLEIIGTDREDAPEWTNLEFFQCSNCTLKSANSPHCPLALQLVKLNSLFASLASYEEVHVDVITSERKISADTTAQRAIGSLMGLIIPASGCPHTCFLRPMARFHLPFSTEEETLYRVSSMYLLAQYFLKKSNKEADMELVELAKVYKNLHEVNVYCTKRLRNASSNDSTVNAVILLDILSKAMPYAIDKSLMELQGLFQSFLGKED